MARILIADDDPSLRYAMSSALQDRQHVVDVAENGQQAIDLCQRNSYDLLLLDFYASGSMALSGQGGAFDGMVTVDTDLTLHPVDADLRQDPNTNSNDAPTTTK